MIVLGTSKGLVVCTEEGRIQDVYFSGFPVSMVYEDRVNATWWAGISHRHWGQKLYHSRDQGKNWTQVSTPKFPPHTEWKPGKPASLKQIWCMAHGGPDKKDRLWLGTEPGALFVSENQGSTFELVESLWNHPSRAKETQWFGAGKDYPFIHTIEVDPRYSDHVYIAVSCAGVFETWDGGASWTPKNKGLIAAYLPNPGVEVGHDPHSMKICKSQPDVIWQQNHCGIFRTTDAGENWENVTDEEGLADYGFGLCIDENDPNTAWVIPADSDESRVPPDLALCVCKTTDGGKTWVPKREGLPQQYCYDIVFRQSFANKENLLVFGTTSGNVYLSLDAGESWKALHANFARVESVLITQE